MRLNTPTLSRISSALLLGSLLLSALPSQADVLTTSYSSNNTRRGFMFDIVTTNALTITSFDINVASGVSTAFSVYYKSGSWSGWQFDPSAWTLLGTQTITSAGTDHATTLDVADLSLAAGVTEGLFITTDGSVASSMRYITGGTTYTNDDLSILPGAGTLQPFAGSLATPRTFSGAIHYTLDALPAQVPEPSSGLLVTLALGGLAGLRRRAH